MWTFSTVPNATWSDGQPLTAKDADFTFNTILKYGDGPAGNLVGGLANVKSVKAIDDNTLVVTYSTPAANVLQELQGIPILPEHVWQQYATGDGKGLRQFPNLPRERAAARERRPVRARPVHEGFDRDLRDERQVLRPEA